MKKNLIIMLFTFILAICLVGCNNNNNSNNNSNIENSNQNTISKTEINVSFDPYKSSNAVLSVTEIDDAGSTIVSKHDLINLKMTEGTKISSALSELGYVAIEPSLLVDIFEGWMKYKVETALDNDGNEILKYTRISENTLFSTNEIFEMTAPNYDVTFVAKWSSIPLDNYSMNENIENETNNTTTFSLYANGGKMNFKDNEVPNFQFNSYTYWLNSGDSLNDAMTGENINSAVLMSLDKENTEFKGWTIYESDNIFWNSEAIDENNTKSFLYDTKSTDLKYIVLENCTTYNDLTSTEEMCEIVSNGKCYYAIANWE